MVPLNTLELHDQYYLTNYKRLFGINLLGTAALDNFVVLDSAKEIIILKFPRLFGAQRIDNVASK